MNVEQELLNVSDKKNIQEINDCLEVHNFVSLFPIFNPLFFNPTYFMYNLYFCCYFSIVFLLCFPLLNIWMRPKFGGIWHANGANLSRKKNQTNQSFTVKTVIVMSLMLERSKNSSKFYPLPCLGFLNFCYICI